MFSVFERSEQDSAISEEFSQTFEDGDEETEAEEIEAEETEAEEAEAKKAETEKDAEEGYFMDHENSEPDYNFI